MVVGAPLASATYNDSSTGAAYVYRRDDAGTPLDTSDDSWLHEARLTASDADNGDQFGISVAISGDTVVVGTDADDDGGSFSGSAYVFTRSVTNWTEQAKLIASDAAAGDSFGFSVSLSGDTAVVGSRLDDDGGTNSGSAYVFTRTGSSWSEQEVDRRRRG